MPGGHLRHEVRLEIVPRADWVRGLGYGIRMEIVVGVALMVAPVHFSLLFILFLSNRKQVGVGPRILEPQIILPQIDSLF